MRIGFDASILGGGGGIAAYAECLLGALAHLCGGQSLVLWCGSRTAAPAVRRLAPSGSRTVTPGPLGRLVGRWGRLGWGNPLSIETFTGPLDVFHGPNYLLPAQRAKAALIITVHDLSAVCHREWHPTRRSLVHRMALGRTVRAVDHVITDTEAIRADVMAHFMVAPERVTAVHPAATPAFAPRPAADLKPALDRWGLFPGGYLLFAGAIEPRKNLARLLDACATLRARRPDLPPLVLVGPPGWRNREIHARIAALHPGARYLGYLPNEDLTTLMAGCAAFVMPSLYEGFGLPILEAMACGVPVVTSRGGALEEVAGGAAVLVDPLEPEAIAAGIERVVGDTDLREVLNRRGLARVEQFSWERTARDTLRVYERAIDARRARSPED